MLAIRLAKIGCVAAIAFYVALVAFGNLSDYWTNFAFVTEVLDMDAVPAASRIRWRAVTSPVLHHAGYILIIATEIVTAALCALGALAMARQVLAKAQPFHAAKSKAVAGLTLGFLLYEGGFVGRGRRMVRHVAGAGFRCRAKRLPRSYDDARRADFRLAQRRGSGVRRDRMGIQ